MGEPYPPGVLRPIAHAPSPAPSSQRPRVPGWGIMIWAACAAANLPAAILARSIANAVLAAVLSILTVVAWRRR